MHDLGLREYLHILRRRKWIVVLAVVIVPAAAVALSLRQSPLYEASADVLLRYQNLPSTLSGISDPNSYSYYVDPIRSTDTQLQVATLPLLTDRVAAALRKRGVPGPSAGDSTGVAAVSDTDVLRFTGRSGTPERAALLATEYARQFTRYRQELDTVSITTAVKGLQRRIDELVAQETSRARVQAAALRTKIDQLETLLTLQTSSAVLVREASGAAKIRPKPTKYGVLGLGLGLVLGVGLAFLRDAFDTRLRSPDQIADVLGLSVLGGIPAPPRQLQRERRLVMVDAPTSGGAEAFRRLRMNLEFASVGKPAQVIMVTSALEEEGKSTTVSNLAVAMALAGKNVALVDLDLRRPSVGAFFRLDERQPGLSSVVLGYASLEDAFVQVSVEPFSSASDNGATENGANARSSVGWGDGEGEVAGGSLSVLPTGMLPPDPGEFVGLESVARVIAALRERSNVVLIDAPPLLHVGDALTIGRLADAVVAIVRLDVAQRGPIGELGAILARMPAEKLGFVLCGIAGFGHQQYGYGYGYGTYGGTRRTPEGVVG
jgi:Mrp family chromosome partitioning ATPase/capsular polysaccharide biosynthesis protein